MTGVNQKVYNTPHQMTARTDRSDFSRYSPAYATGREFGNADGIAQLSSKGEMSCFSFGGRNIRFRTSPRLSRYREVLSWDKGFIEVLAQYGDKVEEEYIDLVSILENLYIDPKSYLASIKKVEVSYV